MSVINSATLKALIESKQEMDKSDLKMDILKFVAYLAKMAIIHDEHGHVVDHKNKGDSGTMPLEVAAIRSMTVIE
jgi:hypothetical protein